MRKVRRAQLAALTLLWMGLAAAAAYAGTFGSYHWGASAATITRETGAMPQSGGRGDLVRRESILGREAYVTYKFDGAGLAAVGIQWDELVFPLVKKALDTQFGKSPCTNVEKGCTWISSRSTIRLVETRSLGVTLLVFMKRP